MSDEAEKSNGGLDLGAMLPMLLSMLGGENGAEKKEPADAAEKAPEEKPEEGFDLSSIMALAGAFSSLSGDDEQVRFLRALKPLLSEDRKGRVDEAVRLLKLVSLLPALQESGLRTNLFGKL